MRLLCGEGQALANLGDSAGANYALDLASEYRDGAYTDDGIKGLFTFSAAKQHYYTGSSLIWVESPANARKAASQATLAIGAWTLEPPETRSLDDEALAQVYLATALAQMGELEGAAEAVSPVLDLPAERHISWISKRLRRLGRIVSERFPGSSLAQDTEAKIICVAGRW
jgi:hypothetical protein